MGPEPIPLLDDFSYLKHSIRNSLEFNKINTIEELLEHTAEDLLGLPRLGPLSVFTLQRWLLDYHRQELKSPHWSRPMRKPDCRQEIKTCGHCHRSFYIFEDLSTRTHNVLHRAGIFTVEDLLEWSAKDILGFKHMGRKTLAELEGWLREEFGLELPVVTSAKFSWATKFKEQTRRYAEDVDHLEARIVKLKEHNWKWQREATVERRKRIPPKPFGLLKGKMVEDGSTPYTLEEEHDVTEQATPV